MRKLFINLLPAISAVLVLYPLVGCGGAKFTGTLCESCGNPTPPADGPVVTSVSPDSVVAGGPGFTLTVTGKNFTSNMSVGGIATTSTTYVSSTEMQAQVPATAIATPGPQTITAVTSPPSAVNFGVQFTIADAPLSGNSGFTVSEVAIQANDMVWDPLSQQLYLSVPASSATDANTITALDPATGKLGISQAAGSEPDKLALSSDDSYLYAGLDGDGSVQRFTLPGLGTDIAIPIGSVANSDPYYAMDVEVAPGSPHTIAVLRGLLSSLVASDPGGVVIYDDAVARPTSVPGSSGYYLIPGTDMLLGSIETIQWKADASTIYGGGENYLDVLSVNSGGAQATNAYQNEEPVIGPVLHYDATTGYIYSDADSSSAGNVVDPSTGKVVGTFPLEAVDGGAGFLGVMVPDGTLNIAYYLGLGENFVQGMTPEYTLEAFDMAHYTLLGAVAIPNVVGTPVKLVRWGTNGLALLTNNNNGSPSTPIPGTGVYLISGAFVTSPGAQQRGTMFRPHP